MEVEVRRDVIEILSLNQDIERDWKIIEKQYKALDIDKVKIDGNPFTNYGDFQFIWEMSYVSEPKRSGNGSIGNLNSYAVFLTPHLTLNFSIMSIDDYRKIMQLHYSIREHTVECYDPIYNRKVKVKMYFATEQMAKLHTIARKRFNGKEWEDWIELVGVREYTVDLIGTNNDLDTYEFGYSYNAPLDDYGKPIYPNGSPIPNEYEESVYVGEEIVVGQSSTFKNNPPSDEYVFVHWEDENGRVYTDGTVVTVNNDTLLRAIWGTTKTDTLSFNYGQAKPTEEILNKTVEYNKPIGTLPNFELPTVTEGEYTYYPYTNGAWYKYPLKEEQFRITENTPYWTTKNDIAYLLYDKVYHKISYITNSEENLRSQYAGYGDPVYMPTLVRQGYTFKGWYLDEQLTQEFTGSMPPYPIELYAKWEQTI